MRIILLIVALLVAPGGLQAQVPAQLAGEGAVRTRADLTQLLTQYEEALASPVYSEAVKASLRANVLRVRDRLENGDFKRGDRIALNVEGELTIPDTIPVLTGPLIALDTFGEISLKGVLRSEIESHLTTEIGRFIKSPVVRASSLMRISIQGAVGAPGFFVVPTDMLLSEAITYAGGLAQNYELDKLRIERGAREILGGQILQDALVAGTTLDQLNLQAGDQIYIPAGATGGSQLVGTLTRIGLIAVTTLLFGVRIAG